MEQRYALAAITVLLLVSLAAAQTSPPPAAAGTAYFKAYDAVLADPESTLPLVRELAGPAARIVYVRETGRLLVYGDATAHGAVAAAAQEVNAPARNVRIEVSFAGQERGSDFAIGVSGGGAVVTGPGGASWEVRARPQVRAGETRVTSSTTQQLLTRSGGEASLAVGQEVPYLRELVQYGHRWGYIAQVYEMRQVGAFLWVRPTVLGGGPMVQVTLTPEVSGLVEGRRQRIRYTRAATTVTVRDGESLTIGAHGEHADFYSLFLAGLSQSRREASTRITLTVHVEAVAGR